MNFLETVTTVFKNDPTFDFMVNKLPKGHFKELVRRKIKVLERRNSAIEEELKDME